MDKLGEGSYGMVMKAKNKFTGKYVAIKLINKNENSEKPGETINEIEMLQNLDHPNIIKLHEIYENDAYVFLVQDLCECDMLQFFSYRGGATKGDLQILCIKLLSALAYCHKKGVVHRDIKF
jgi:calcium-dependent protein kinase